MVIACALVLWRTHEPKSLNGHVQSHPPDTASVSHILHSRLLENGRMAEKDNDPYLHINISITAVRIYKYEYFEMPVALFTLFRFRLVYMSCASHILCKPTRTLYSICPHSVIMCIYAFVEYFIMSDVQMMCGEKLCTSLKHWLWSVF